LKSLRRLWVWFSGYKHTALSSMLAPCALARQQRDLPLLLVALVAAAAAGAAAGGIRGRFKAERAHSLLDARFGPALARGHQLVGGSPGGGLASDRGVEGLEEVAFTGQAEDRDG